jgi:hypothetical protein
VGASAGRSAAVARWTRDAVAGASARVNQALTQRGGDPARTWPSPTSSGRSPEEAEFVARFGAGPDTPSRPSHRPGTGEIEQPSSWIEAAAGTWLGRHDDPLNPPRAERAAETGPAMTPFPPLDDSTELTPPPDLTSSSAGSSAG